MGFSDEFEVDKAAEKSSLHSLKMHISQELQDRSLLSIHYIENWRNCKENNLIVFSEHRSNS